MPGFRHYLAVLLISPDAVAVVRESALHDSTNW